MITREAKESDALGIRDVIVASYGDHYPYPQFYDVDTLRKLILGEDTLMLVAEEPESRRVVGTASVLQEIGAYSDLLGEFGRLAVLPDRRGRGIGGMLMRDRLSRVREWLHVGIVDARVVRSFSLRIAEKHGFAPVGFSPMKDLFRRRESTGILAQWFDGALALRCNNPRFIPEVQPIACLAMDHARLPMDGVIDDSSAPYPHDGDFELDELTTQGYSSLLRIERGRTRHREVFGPMRLHYGFFKLLAARAEYLLARKGPRVAGAVGFTRDDAEKAVRIFELISPDDQAVLFLLREVERRCREVWDTAYIEIDVRADAPRMQRTLLELGFVPIAYVPAMVFHEVERHDIVRMARVLVPVDLGPMDLTPRVQAIADVVLEALAHQELVPRIEPMVGHAALFRGLTSEQIGRIARICHIDRFAASRRVITQGETGTVLHLILAGRADIDVNGCRVGSVGAGEALGEMGLLDARPHTATATVIEGLETAATSYDDLEQLVRCRPDIGVVIYRNLARGLGHKLERADQLERT